MNTNRVTSWDAEMRRAVTKVAASLIDRLFFDKYIGHRRARRSAVSQADSQNTHDAFGTETQIKSNRCEGAESFSFHRDDAE